MRTATMTTNRIQRLQLELIREATFNAFDGDAVVDSLLAHRELWRGVIIDRAGYYAEHARRDGRDCDPIDLIKLRDLDAGYWNVDTLYLTAQPGHEDELKALAETWSADEIGWTDDPNAGRVLRVWFD